MKKIMAICAMVIAVAALGGCSSSKSKTGLELENKKTEDTGEKEKNEPVKKMKDVVLEAEEAGLLGQAAVAADTDGYSGSGYVSNLTKEGDGVKFDFEAGKEGAYDLVFRVNSNGDYKEMNVGLDGATIGSLKVQTNGFGDCRFQKVWLETGKHGIELVSGWGYVDVDSLTVREADPVGDETYTEAVAEPCNPDATKEAKNLYKYLLSIYGKKTLSGQHAENNSMTDKDFQAIKKSTGKMPALMEVDFMKYSGSEIEKGSDANYDNIAKNAVTFANEGGIIAASWHWNAPTQYLLDDADHPWYQGFYKENTNIPLDRIMYGQDEEGYNLLLEDIDRIAEVFKTLQDKGVPVLFRPLHEANGGWFWWGAFGEVPYKELYRMIYDRLVNYHELNNILWVWNADDPAWYPGNDCVDIASTDVYADSFNYGTQVNSFLQVNRASGRTKMTALAECGVLPDPEKMAKENVHWLYTATWNGYLADDGMIIDLSNKYTEEDRLKKFYSSEDIITLDELPDWKNGKFE